MFQVYKKITLSHLIIVGYCLFLFAYVLFRAWNLSFTFDEVTTVQIATDRDWANFTDTTNNQILTDSPAPYQ